MDPLAEELAAIDVVLERAAKVLQGDGIPPRKETAS